jgi:hypothetical protein
MKSASDEVPAILYTLLVASVCFRHYLVSSSLREVVVSTSSLAC